MLGEGGGTRTLMSHAHSIQWKGGWGPDPVGRYLHGNEWQSQAPFPIAGDLPIGSGPDFFNSFEWTHQTACFAFPLKHKAVHNRWETALVFPANYLELGKRVH